jgi:hypothetical protein
MKSRKI